MHRTEYTHPKLVGNCAAVIYFRSIYLQYNIPIHKLPHQMKTFWFVPSIELLYLRADQFRCTRVRILLFIFFPWTELMFHIYYGKGHKCLLWKMN